MASNHSAPGDVLQHTASSAITSGSVVVMNGLLGVALGDIASGETGSVAIGEVWTLPKVSGADISQGQTMTWDISESAFDDDQATAASGDITGPTAVAAADAGTGEETVKVLLTGVPGTVN